MARFAGQAHGCGLQHGQPPRPTGRGGGDGSPCPSSFPQWGWAAPWWDWRHAFRPGVSTRGGASGGASVRVRGLDVLCRRCRTRRPERSGKRSWRGRHHDRAAAAPARGEARDRAYPLYGLRDAAARAVARLTNSPMIGKVFGDSSYVVNYVRAIGYHQPQVQQSGSNLGTAFKHDTPFLSTIGTGTMIADGVSFMNTDHSATSFKVRPGGHRRKQLPGQRHSSTRPGPGPGTTACSRPRSWSPSTDRCATTWACSARRRSRSPARSCGTPSPRSMRAVPASAGTSRPRTGTTCAPSRS